MPKKYQKNNTRYQTDDFRFVQYRLSADEKKKFIGWAETNADDMGITLGTIISTGHKTSISFTSNDNTFIASITCLDEASENYRKVMVSRHPDWIQALLLGVFKINVIFSGKAWPVEGDSSDWG